MPTPPEEFDFEKSIGCLYHVRLLGGVYLHPMDCDLALFELSETRNYRQIKKLGPTFVRRYIEREGQEPEVILNHTRRNPDSESEPLDIRVRLGLIHSLDFIC